MKRSTKVIQGRWTPSIPLQPLHAFHISPFERVVWVVVGFIAGLLTTWLLVLLSSA